jgi:hypothetical protein
MSFAVFCVIAMAVAGQSFFMMPIFGFTADNFKLWSTLLSPHYQRVSVLLPNMPDPRASMVGRESSHDFGVLYQGSIRSVSRGRGYKPSRGGYKQIPPGPT